MLEKVTEINFEELEKLSPKYCRHIKHLYNQKENDVVLKYESSDGKDETYYFLNTNTGFISGVTFEKENNDVVTFYLYHSILKDLMNALGYDWSLKN